MLVVELLNMLYKQHMCVTVSKTMFFSERIALRVFIGGDGKRYYYWHSVHVDGAYPPSGSRSISTRTCVHKSLLESVLECNICASTVHT